MRVALLERELPLAEHYQTAFDGFFSEIKPIAASYARRVLRYAAVRSKNGFEFIQGVLVLDVGPRFEIARRYESADIICEEIALEDLRLTPRGLVNTLLKGSVKIGNNTLQFPQPNPGSYAVFHNAFDGTTFEQRGFASRLQVNAADDIWHFTQQPRIYQQIKSGSPPYNDLNHLGSDFGLVLDRNLCRTFEIRTSRVVHVSETSRVRATSAEVDMLLPKTLKRSRVKVGLRVEALGIRLNGTSKSGSDIAWSEDGDRWSGHTTTAAVLDSKVHCTLSYSGLPQQDSTLIDPDRQINSLRIAYELFDGQSAVLKKVIDNRIFKDRKPFSLELTVGALLAMRGFRTIQLDQLPGIEGPDILASDPLGNILVVECALDVPEATAKLSKLDRRTRAIRLALADRNRKDVGVAAVLAVAQFPDELSFTLKEAEAHGILVWTADKLEAMRELEGRPDAAEFYQELSQTREFALRAAMDDED